MSTGNSLFPGSIQTFDGFQGAARQVLQFLHSRLGFGLWMVTRTLDDDWIVLVAEDYGYDVQDGTVLRWSDSFCSRMVLGLGPQIAPRAEDVPAYMAAPIGQQVPIAAYIGIPLQLSNGRLFGTLCAIDPRPQPASIQQELPLIQLQAQLLSALLASELKSQEMSRRLQQAQYEAQIDALTGLYNRRGWDSWLEQEEERCRIFGHPALVMVVDLDNLKQVNDRAGHLAGDELIRSAASCLRRSFRASDIVARIGGDEFAVLMVDFKELDKMQLVVRIQNLLTRMGVAASIGWAVREAKTDAAGKSQLMTLTETMHQADHMMYLCKQQRKASSYR